MLAVRAIVLLLRYVCVRRPRGVCMRKENRRLCPQNLFRFRSDSLLVKKMYIIFYGLTEYALYERIESALSEIWMKNLIK